MTRLSVKGHCKSHDHTRVCREEDATETDTFDHDRREQENYFQDHSDNLVRKLKERCKSGPLDMTTWFNLVAFDIVSDLAFGEPSGCVNNPDQPWIQAILARAKAIVWFQLAVQYGFMEALIWLTPRYVTESRKKHIAMTEAKLKSRMECKNPGKDFM